MNTVAPVACNEVNVCHPQAQCIRSPEQADAYVCRCNEGFLGDGIQCSGRTPATPPTGAGRHDEDEEELSCDLNDICGAHATCIYNDDTLRSVCVCNQGYRGDGFTCLLIDGCSGPADCHTNAQVFIPVIVIGISSVIAIQCFGFAQCQYNHREQRYQCRCNADFEGDGRSCTRISPG